jgi:pimeloyl-ACP methyl ester carboxylesterase
MKVGIEQKLQAATSPDGTKIACWRVGEGPPLILVHGTTADHTRWAPLLPALAQRFEVYAVDRRGRGASGDAADYSIEREFEDLAAVVDSIQGPVNLLGHSFGAICSLEAAHRTRNVARLVLYEPPLAAGVQIYDPAIIRRMESMLAAGDREGVVTAMMLEVVKVPPSQFELLRSLPAWPARVAAANTIVRELQASAETGHDWESYQALRIPTLLLLGGDSPPLFKRAIERLAEILPNSRIAIMPGQQHAAMDTGTDTFLKEVVNFLAA